MEQHNAPTHIYQFSSVQLTANSLLLTQFAFGRYIPPLSPLQFDMDLAIPHSGEQLYTTGNFHLGARIFGVDTAATFVPWDFFLSELAIQAWFADDCLALFILVDNARCRTSFAHSRPLTLSFFPPSLNTTEAEAALSSASFQWKTFGSDEMVRNNFLALAA